MRDCGVPTASHVMFRDREEAVAHLACASYPAVLKADVLAAGKGVIIAADEREAREAVDVFFGEKRFGETEVVLEEFLEGEELSLLALCDGERAVPLAPAQDYKRIFDGDGGPNTGGMGSYSPVPGIDADRAREIARAVHQPVVDELRRRGTPFHGVLYAGLMMTPDGGRRCSSTTAASATRRPRPCCRACARTCWSCSRPRRDPAGSRGWSPSGRGLGRDRGARLARLPGVVLERRRDHAGSTSSRARGLPRGHGRAGRRDRDGRRPGAERDRARRHAGRGARPRLRGRGAASEFDGKQMRTRHRRRGAVERVAA